MSRGQSQGRRGLTAVAGLLLGLAGPAAVGATLPLPAQAGDAGVGLGVPALVPPAPIPMAESASELFTRENLDPYFAQGPLVEAKREFDHHRFRKARKLLEDAGDDPPVRLLRALALLGEGQFAAAQTLFEALADDVPVLRDYCLFHVGLASKSLRRWETAAESFDAVSEGSSLYVDARFELAKVVHHQRDLAGAREALKPLWDRPPTAKDVPRINALMASARIAREQGAYGAEHRALLEVWSHYPLSPQAAEAGRRLSGVPFPSSAKVTRAEALIDAHLHHEATALLSRLLPQLKMPDPVACRAQAELGIVLRLERRHAQAIRVLTPVLHRCRDPELLARTLSNLGYSQSILSPGKAVETYLDLAQRFPDAAEAAPGLLAAAELELRSDDRDAALEHLNALVKSRTPSAAQVEARFRLFWLHWEAKDYPEALKVLSQASAFPGFAKAEGHGRGNYWKARVLERMERKDEAAALFETVASDRAASYYGLMARARLEKLAPERAERVKERLVAPAKAGDHWPLHPGPLAQEPHFRAAVELIRLGLPGATRELLAVDLSSQTNESIQLLLQVLQRAGLGGANAARVLASSAVREGFSHSLDPESRAVWELAFSSKFRDHVEKQSKAAKVNPNLMQALIREESGFNPRARSQTGALGLAQLMPSTALELAHAKKLRYSRAGLFDPRRNIQLGSLYLGTLLESFGGNAAYAAASYNAGPGAVRRWLKLRPDDELDEWVEEIPLEETRGYVKRVLGSYNAYELLFEASFAAPVVLGAKP